MNNAVRIMVSGGIATVIQRAMELNPVSLVGFTVFIAIFAVVSAIWVYFAPKEDVQIKQLSQDEKE
jgi:gamma-glutamylcysteine synthetase